MVTLGRLDNDTNHLDQAIVVQGNAVEAFTRSGDTESWAKTLVNRANARIALAEREQGIENLVFACGQGEHGQGGEADPGG